MSQKPTPLYLAIALDGAGWHPAAWREPNARPAELLHARYWVDVVRDAEDGLVDFVTIEDSLGLQSSRYDGPDPRPDHVRGRLDAVQVAARVAPVTTHVGLVPTITTTHTEPFHISKAIATLDYVSNGRAGLRAQLSRAWENPLFGRRPADTLRIEEMYTPSGQVLMADRFDEAGDFVEVVRRLWDSWEDDAEIRDAATSRFIDRDKVHYIDFDGRWFSVRGPSITPRPPQGQPLVTVLGHATIPYRLGARSADVVYVTPTDVAHASAIVAEVHAEQTDAGRAEELVHVFADLLVVLDETTAAATARLARLDAVAGEPLHSDAAIVATGAGELADHLQALQQAGISGFRLRPAAIPDDVRAITRLLVPELQRRGVFRTTPAAGTFRARLGLQRPASRYATIGTEQR